MPHHNPEKQFIREQYNNDIAARSEYQKNTMDMLQIEKNAQNKEHRRVAPTNEPNQVEPTHLKLAQLPDEQAEQEELHERLRRERQQRYHEQKVRQQIRESNQELRELASKLRAAYVGKGIHQQVLEREAALQEERINAMREHQIMERARAEEEEEAKRVRADEAKKKEDLRLFLQDQIIESHMRYRQLYEEFLREKHFLDEIVRRIQEDHIREMNMKMAKRHQLQADMEEVRRFQEQWKEQEQREIEAENIRIRKYVEEQEAKLKAQKEESERKAIEKQEISQQLGQEIHDFKVKSQIRENLLIDLYRKEKEEKEEQKIKASLEHTLRKRIHARLMLEEQRHEIAERKYLEKEDEKKFQEEQMRLMAERDKIEQMSAEKRRRKQMEHRRAVQETLEAKRVQRAKEVLELLERRDIEIRDEEMRQKIIEEERLRLIKEHAAELLGFLPKGVLRENDVSAIHPFSS